MNNKWIIERKRDYYYRLAKKEGYRSRAAYKLIQAVEKYHFIKEGDVIVDFGAFPGGWMQVARKIVGEEGYVLGVDLKPIDNFGLANISSVVFDVEKLKGYDVLRKIPREADVVLSDLSPNVSGVWSLDHARQIYLSETSLKLAVSVLRIGGNFFVKIFQGSTLRRFIDDVKAIFRTVRIIKPKASRKRSAEIYVVALGFNG